MLTPLKQQINSIVNYRNPTDIIMINVPSRVYTTCEVYIPSFIKIDVDPFKVKNMLQHTANKAFPRILPDIQG